MNLEEKYKSYTNKQLIEIVLKAEDYQATAVEIAKSILEEREINEAEKIEVKKAIEIDKQKEELQLKKQVETQDRIISFLRNLIAKVNPFDNKENASKKIVNIALLVFGYLFLVQFYNGFSFLVILLQPPIHLDELMLLTLLEIIYLPLTIYYFYKKKKIGLMMLLVWLSYFATSSIVIIIHNLSISSSDLDVFLTDGYKTNYIRLISYSLFYIVSIFVLSRKNIRALFFVSKVNVGFSIAIGICAILIVLGGFYYLIE